MMRMSSMPARAASSTTYWIAGLSTTGSISLGCAFVTGRNRVPSPAAGITALRTFIDHLGPRGRAPHRCGAVAPPLCHHCTEWTVLDILGTPSRRVPALPEPSMPTYEYRCKDCGEHLEVVQSFTDDALTECPACGGTLRKVFGNIGITFKGSGFYKTDSRKAASSASKSSNSDSATESTSSGDAKPSTPSEGST